MRHHHDDQHLRTNCVTVRWERGGCTSHRTVIPGDSRILFTQVKVSKHVCSTKVLYHKILESLKSPDAERGKTNSLKENPTIFRDSEDSRDPLITANLRPPAPTPKNLLNLAFFCRFVQKIIRKRPKSKPLKFSKSAPS